MSAETCENCRWTITQTGNFSALCTLHAMNHARNTAGGIGGALYGPAGTAAGTAVPPGIGQYLYDAATNNSLGIPAPRFSRSSDCPSCLATQRVNSNPSSRCEYHANIHTRRDPNEATRWMVMKYPFRYGAVTLPPGVPVVVIEANDRTRVFKVENYGHTEICLSTAKDGLGLDATKCVVLYPEELVYRTLPPKTVVFGLATQDEPGVVIATERPVDPKFNHTIWPGSAVEPPDKPKGRREWKEPNE